MTVVDWTIEPSRWACTPFITTPGASCASCRKLRFCSGRFCTVSVGIVKDRSPLAVWICGASLLTVTVSDGAADLDREDTDRDPRAGVDRDARLPEGLERRHLDFDGVGVGGQIREHEVAVRVGRHRNRSGAACLADERHRRAGDHGPLRVFHGAADRAGGQLRRRRQREQQQDDARAEGPDAPPGLSSKSSSFSRSRRRTIRAGTAQRHRSRVSVTVSRCEVSRMLTGDSR